MRFAYSDVMEAALEAAINEWHLSVNAGDLRRSARAVGDPVVVLGPKGAGPITAEQFADWVERSGIKLTARSWHPISERLMVVEEDATWPQSKAPTRVATVFRVSEGKVTAALRLPDLKSALELAYICREMAATEMSEPGPGQLLFEFVRHWSRRSPAAEHHAAEQGRLVLVTEAVQALAQRGTAATVNAVAHEIGIDQSGASRLIKSAVQAGHLSMLASKTDARLRHASVTASGLALLQDAHRWQERVFDQLTEGWSAQRRRDFQQAMTDLIDRSHTLDS